MSLKRKNAYDINSSQKKAKSNFFAPRSSVLAGDGSKDSAMPMFTYTPKAAGTARLVTWNVNGVKSLDEKVVFVAYSFTQFPYSFGIRFSKDISKLKTQTL